MYSFRQPFFAALLVLATGCSDFSTSTSTNRTVEAQLTPETIVAGASAEVICIARNEGGSIIPAQTMVFAVNADAVKIEDHVVSSVIAGEHLIGCAFPDSGNDPLPADRRRAWPH